MYNLKNPLICFQTCVYNPKIAHDNPKLDYPVSSFCAQKKKSKPRKTTTSHKVLLFTLPQAYPLRLTSYILKSSLIGPLYGGLHAHDYLNHNM